HATDGDGTEGLSSGAADLLHPVPGNPLGGGGGVRGRVPRFPEVPCGRGDEPSVERDVASSSRVAHRAVRTDRGRVRRYAAVSGTARRPWSAPRYPVRLVAASDVEADRDEG